MYPVAAAAEKVVKNIVFQQIFLNEVGQSYIGNQTQRLLFFLFTVDAVIPWLLSMDVLDFLVEFIEHFLLVLSDHLFFHLFLLHYLFSLGFELFNLFFLDFFQILLKFFLLFLYQSNLFQQYFWEETSQTGVEKGPEEIFVVIVAIDEVEGKYLSDQDVQKVLKLWVARICQLRDEFHAFLYCEWYELRTVHFVLLETRVGLVTCEIGHFCIWKREGVASKHAIVDQILKRNYLFLGSKFPFLNNDMFGDKLFKKFLVIHHL